MQQSNRINLLPQDGEAYFFKDYFTRDESDAFYQQLMDSIYWKQVPIKIFGKDIMQPRLTAFYGDHAKPYSYSGVTAYPEPWNAALVTIREKIEILANTRFSSALLNQYRSGQDSMGWHRDNERSLGVNPIIGSVSFGATRRFDIRHYYYKKIVRSVELDHGSFLLMQGTTQHFWEHRVARSGKVEAPRINITFRVIQ